MHEHEQIPPLRVKLTGGENVIPVFTLELSGGTLTKTGQASVKYAPSAASTSATIDIPYVVMGTDAGLTKALLLTASDNVTVSTDANSVFISATTSNISGLNKTISWPLAVTSGGTGLSAAGSGGTLLGTSTGGTTLEYKVLAASDNATVLHSGSSILISATTPDISGKQDSLTIPLVISSGGTGLNTITAFGLITGSGTNALYSLGSMNAGALVVGSGLTQHPMIMGSGAQGTMLMTSGGAPGGLSWVATAGEVVYAGTGVSYIVLGADATLTNEHVLTASDNVVITTNATIAYISANTPNVGVYNKTITWPLPVNSGGTALNAAGSAWTVLGVNSSGTPLEYQVLAASDNATLVHVGSVHFISATTPNLSGYQASLTASTGTTLTGALISVNPNIREKALGIFAGGNVSTAMDAEAARIYIPHNMTLSKVYLAASIAPTGSGITIDLVQYNATMAAGTSVFYSTSMASIGSTLYVGSITSFEIPTLTAGSYLGFYVKQAGSTVAGSNLTITVVAADS